MGYYVYNAMNTSYVLDTCLCKVYPLSLWMLMAPFLLPFFCLSRLPRGHSCSQLRYACLEIFTIPWIMFRRQAELRLSVPLLDHNCLSHCSLWSSAGSLDYMLSLHMPCWLRIHDSSSAVPSLPWFSILFEQIWAKSWPGEKKKKTKAILTVEDKLIVFAFGKEKAINPNVLCTCSSFCLLCRNFAKEVPKELIILCTTCQKKKKKKGEFFASEV